MKKHLLTGLFLAVFGLFPTLTRAQSPSPEAEMRSTWIATVFSIDWPRTSPDKNGTALRVSSTGNQTEIKRQKDKLTEILDSLAINNFNAAKLQVRSRCDAMYKSSYEPWSSDLVSKRGMDPGYDPLEFFVEECHKRGLEAHAWINPYRYETVVGAFNGTPRAYRDEHPDWLIDVGTTSYLNPALPEVRQRICDVVSEIISNYDVDGLLFDDYFYIQGINQEDASHYQAYKDNGGKLGLKDWRRDNINQMVRDVYKTIKSIKPWVRFGIGPAGITCTSADQATKHNVPQCTSGSDYQYNGIYSDPLAWLEDKSLDYISPQIYWGIGYASADFDIISKWWSDRMPRYNRHLFISKDISSLTETGDWSGVPIQYASGPGVTTYDQYRKQVEMTRNYSTDGEPGSVFYSAKFISGASPLFGHFLKTNVYARKALLPSMRWIPAVPQGLVEDVSLNGTTLSWTPLEGMRYAVFGHTDSDREVLGFTYDNKMEIPAKYAANGKVSVAVYDRYGNVYALRTVGADLTTLGKTEITSPRNGETIGTPFDFTWSEVDGAQSYILEIARNYNMDSLIETRRIDGATSINSSDLENITFNNRLYARIRPIADNARSVPSEPILFNAFRPEILYPQNDSIIDNLAPEIRWTSFNGEADIEIAEDAAFKNTVWSIHGLKGSYPMMPYILQSHKDYWIRIISERDGRQSVSEVVHFRTPGVEELVPGIIEPMQNGIFYANSRLRVDAPEGVKNIRVEVSATENFPSRSIYVTTIPSGEKCDTKLAQDIKLGNKALVDGETYFARARATYNKEEGGTVNTDYSSVVTFTYSSEKWEGVDDIERDNQALCVTVEGKILKISGVHGDTLTVTDAVGRTIFGQAKVDSSANETSVEVPVAGVYLVSDGISTVKVIVK